MAVETKLTLEHDTIERLQNLIEINIDSYNWLIEAAERVRDKQISSVFRELAAQRSSQAAELKGLVSANGEEPEHEGTWGGAADRMWLRLKRNLLGSGPHWLADVERQEDEIKARYAEALRDIAGSAVTDVLNRHFRSLKTAQQRIQMLREMEHV